MAYRTIQSDTGTFSYDGHQMKEATGDENFTLTWDENGQIIDEESSRILNNITMFWNGGISSNLMKIDNPLDRYSE